MITPLEMWAACLVLALGAAGLSVLWFPRGKRRGWEASRAVDRLDRGHKHRLCKKDPSFRRTTF